MIRLSHALPLIALAAPLAMAAPPASGQAAGDAAAAVAETAEITLRIMRRDLAGAVAFADVGITHELPPGTTCDTVSGGDGVLRCRVPCNPADTFNKLFRAVTEDRSDYDRLPARVTARLVGCRIEPATMTVTYRHFRVAEAENDAELRSVVAVAALPAGVLEATADSSAVAAALTAITERPDRALVVGRFQKAASNRAALALRAGRGDVAAQFSAYATAAANVMVADIVRRYSPEGGTAIAKSGRIADFILNTGKAAALAEDAPAATDIPADLQAETAARLAGVNQGGKLDGAAQADVYRLWSAHQQFEPMM